LRLLLDEMYAAAHAQALRAAQLDVSTVVELGLAGASDADLFAGAVAQERTLLTENVADFTRIAAEHLVAGRHHPGVLIALSSRFSRRRAGIPASVEAIRGVEGRPPADRVVYLGSPGEA
jgi:Domain of unknown function (DUF5615)